MKLLVVVLAGLALCACAVLPSKLTGLTTATGAVQAASQNPNGGAQGDFVLTVNAIGVTPRHTFLDSTPNYRSHDNLAIAMSPEMARQVASHLGTRLANLKRRRIVVKGIAKRVPIYFVRGGRYTGRHYYQTWVRIHSPAQVNFAH